MAIHAEWLGGPFDGRVVVLQNDQPLVIARLVDRPFRWEVEGPIGEVPVTTFRVRPVPRGDGKYWLLWRENDDRD